MGRPLFYEFVPKACQTGRPGSTETDDESGLADTRFVVVGLAAEEGMGSWENVSFPSSLIPIDSGQSLLFGRQWDGVIESTK